MWVWFKGFFFFFFCEHRQTVIYVSGTVVVLGLNEILFRSEGNFLWGLFVVILSIVLMAIAHKCPKNKDWE